MKSKLLWTLEFFVYCNVFPNWTHARLWLILCGAHGAFFLRVHTLVVLTTASLYKKCHHNIFWQCQQVLLNTKSLRSTPMIHSPKSIHKSRYLFSTLPPFIRIGEQEVEKDRSHLRSYIYPMSWCVLLQSYIEEYFIIPQLGLLLEPSRTDTYGMYPCLEYPHRQSVWSHRWRISPSHD